MKYKPHYERCVNAIHEYSNQKLQVKHAIYGEFFRGLCTKFGSAIRVWLDLMIEAE